MSKSDLFGFVKPRAAPRVMMHMTDAGEFPDGKSAAVFVCRKCRRSSGWIYATHAEIRRGIPCSDCNAN